MTFNKCILPTAFVLGLFISGVHAEVDNENDNDKARSSNYTVQDLDSLHYANDVKEALVRQKKLELQQKETEKKIKDLEGHSSRTASPPQPRPIPRPPSAPVAIGPGLNDVCFHGVFGTGGMLTADLDVDGVRYSRAQEGSLLAGRFRVESIEYNDYSSTVKVVDTKRKRSGERSVEACRGEVVAGGSRSPVFNRNTGNSRYARPM